MPKNIQNVLSKPSSSTMPSAHSYTVMSSLKSIQNDDDDDICPVCESECTCKSNSSQLTSVPVPLPVAPVSVPAASLKIKLPPRALFQNPTATQTSPPTKRSRTKVPKQKQTIADSVTADGTATTSSNNYVLIHHPAALPTPSVDFYPGTGGSASTSAAQSTSHILYDSSPLTPEPELEPSPSRPKHTPKKSKGPRKKSTALGTKPSARRQTTKKKSTLTSRSRTKNKDVTWLSPNSRRKGKQPVSDDSDSYSDDETYIATMIMNSDGESVNFPTFVSAMSSASDNDDVTTSIADSLDSDSSIRAEEEELIISEEQRAKVRYELFRNEESWHMDKRKWDHLKNSNNWEIRPRKRSVGPDDSGTNSDTESESEMEVDAAEDEEGEGDEDDDPDIGYRHGRGLVTGWPSSDDEDFDAELFFTTLSDSSGPGSDADAEDGEDSGDETDHSDLSSISLREAVAAGLLSPLGVGCPFVVTEDWDGRLIFTNGLRDGQGVLDVHFEVSAAQRQRSIREAMEVDTEGALPSAENDQEEEDEEDDLISDDGETTDDMLDQETPHVVPLPIRYPTPPIASIDPLSTLSPIVGSKRPKFPVPVDSPKPADILAGAGKVLSELSSANRERSRSASVDTLSTPGVSVSSSQSRQPRMGSFVTVTRDPQRSAIVDGTKAHVFSPFSRSTRVGRGRERKRIMVGNDIPHPLKRTRQASLPSDSRTSSAIVEMDDPVVQSSPELPLPTSIGLDDVLDASFLDSDDSISTSVTTFDAHLRNLTRWDRVPVSTFRRSRTAHVGMLPVTAPPSDGVSYGSTGGHVLRRSPGSVPLWLRDKSPHTQTPGSVTVSPVIFPVRAGEEMTVVMEEFQDLSHEENHTTPGNNIGLAKSHKQKRKEKKKSAQIAKARAQAETAAVFTASAAFSDFSSLPAFVPPLSL